MTPAPNTIDDSLDDSLDDSDASTDLDTSDFESDDDSDDDSDVVMDIGMEASAGIDERSSNILNSNNSETCINITTTTAPEPDAPEAATESPVCVADISSDTTASSSLSTTPTTTTATPAAAATATTTTATTIATYSNARHLQPDAHHQSLLMSSIPQSVAPDRSVAMGMA